MIRKEILKELCATPSPSGYEEKAVTLFEEKCLSILSESFGEQSDKDDEKIYDIHRDAIGCDIDTAGIDAADAQRGIADAHSGIARRSERGGHIEQEGDVHAYILARDLCPRDIGKSDRRRPGSPGRHDIYTLELYSPQGITTQMARCTGHAASAHQHKG